MVLRGRLFWVSTVVVAAVAVRFVPYLAPIRASDVAGHGQAVSFDDRNGLPLGTILAEDGNYTTAVPLSAVSPHFVQAIEAAEDARFERHGPVDSLAMARAVVQDLRERQAVSGASTITMQLARMVHPSSSTIVGKIEQLWTSWRIAAGMSREDILAAYVNRVPMGSNIYGVEGAARAYFGIPAARLDLAQSSLLAAIPNDPPGLYPYEHWSRVKARQGYVLQQMAKGGTITPSQAQRAAEEDISLRPRGEGIVAAPHFLFWLGARLPPATATVRTTIDRGLQRFVEGQVGQVIADLKRRNVHHAAALVVDNHTREVLAYVGSPDYFSEADMGRNDGVQALRQPGSALKPFLYELALESGTIRPNSILADVPAHYAIPGGLLYSPVDYNGGYMGPVRVRAALANSLNVPAVRVLSDVGVARFLDRLHELGFGHLNESPDYYGLGLTLGGGEVSLWELTRAYVTLANAGVPGDLVTTLPASGSGVVGRIGDRSAWELVTNILADRYARSAAFGVHSILDAPFDAAVKTGTSSDFRDTWTLGFTRDFTVGVWVGNFSGDPMRHVSGVTGAAPLWNRIVLHLHEHADPAAFPEPSGLRLEPICADTGMRPDTRCTTTVFEYLYPRDLPTYFAARSAPAVSATYDDWAALQDTPPPERFHILFPHNDAVFVLHSRQQGAEPTFQALRLRVAGQRGPVQFWVNGRAIRTDGPGTAFWPVRAGTWTLRATSQSGTDQVTFTVEAEQRGDLRRGFSIEVGSK